MTELEHAITHIKTRADAWAVKEVTEALQSISERLDKALSQEPCEDAEQIDYHDDFATALKKINDYEMTRDERVAISILNAYKEGYESAIEDYKQEPCDDAISRKDAKEIIAKNDETDGTVPIFTGKIVQQMLDSLPSVTPIEVIHRDRTVQDFVDKCLECGRIRKGHWIKGEEWCETVGGFERWGNDYTCSECGLPLERYTLTDFCPNCGAKMESEDE